MNSNVHDVQFNTHDCLRLQSRVTTNHILKAAMITRKRGRVISNSTDYEEKQQLQGNNALKAIDSESVRNEQSSPESDSNDWGLDDLLSSDFSWAFNSDELSPFADIGMQDPVQSTEGHLDLASDVSISHNGGSVQRQKLRDLSGRINKNAIAARMNRLKKKEYLNGLEERVGSLTSENRLLKQENNSLNKRVEELENETRYLRAVLANESMLAQLLSRLSGMNGMKFSTSLFQGSSENDHDYAMPRKRVKVEDKGAAGGVCLHVDKDHVSVEFCTKCAESASSSLKMCLVCPAGRAGLRTSTTP